MLHEIGRRTSHRKSIGKCRPLLLLFTAMCLSRDHVIVTCIFAYLYIFFFLRFKVIKTARCKIKIGSFVILFLKLVNVPVIDGFLNSSCFFCSPHFSFLAAETKINLRVFTTCAELLPLLSGQQDTLFDPSCHCSLVNVSFYWCVSKPWLPAARNEYSDQLA